MNQEQTAQGRLAALNQQLVQQFVRQQDLERELKTTNEAIRDLRNMIAGASLGRAIECEVREEAEQADEPTE